jgi:acetyltransferase-like isoleucine patch superfamily enzyme
MLGPFLLVKLMQLIDKLRGYFFPGTMAHIGSGSRIKGRVERRHPGGVICIGNDCLLAATLVVESSFSKIEIGNNVFMGGGTLVDCLERVSIEDDVLISYQVIIMDSDNHSLRATERVGDLARWRRGTYSWDNVERAPVIIRKKAWIGARAMILKGVEVGEGGVVASGAVVTRSVPPYTIVAGNPARVIRELGLHER